MEIEGFESLGIFYDDANFPRGFSKSGEFTIAESEVLHNYGIVLSALEDGTRSPGTSQEKHFMAVCAGKKEPQSLLEKTWLKYRARRSGRKAISAFGRAKADPAGAEAIDDFSDDDILDDDD